eukprot:TRINITY_DN5330_c0_g1_i1.p1 TRINITY_DN5330_c0_g1~~TRINITY_DN5330_c0_g1_i1.p1  ORF type:complete len:211 (-),score=45.30 TRINITY_DN5330_c0_g1_i1:229-825(-)
MKSVLFFITISLLVAFSSACLGKCKDETKQAGTCSMKFHVCGCLHWFKWRYDATATASGVSAHVSGYKSGTGAAENAAFQLFNKLDSCNCAEQDVPIGKCTFSARGCFYFSDVDHMNKQSPLFRLTVTDKKTGKAGHVSGYAKAEDAFPAALADLSAKEDLSVCNDGSNAAAVAPKFEVPKIDSFEFAPLTREELDWM